jgi:ABC-type multidrug transport system fused ATPase/permease subunit
VVATVGTVHVTSMFIAAAVLRLVTALVMMPLSAVDHSRSPRPSTLLTSYLSFSLLLDAAQARTLFLSSNTHPERIYSGLFCAAVALKAFVLLLEARQKTRWVRWVSNEKEHSPEETSGIFSLGAFFWLNKLFLVGYSTVLTNETLLPLDSSIDAEALHAKFSQRINYAKLKSDKFAVTKALAYTLRVPLLLPIAPRLAQLGFTICQPLFIERLLRYLSEPKLDANVGYGLIGATFLIYLGITISGAFTWYFHHRLRIIVRSVLVPEIFIKATNARIGIEDDSAALTLMSTDMERITAGLRTLHETWACLIQASLASWMLYSRLGIVFVVPIGMVVSCTIGLGILMHFIADAQRAWMTRVQKRVGLTATVIASMKNLKISGLTAVVGSFMQNLRLEELAAASRFRVILIIAALFGFTPMLITPPLTFAFTQRRLDASTMFTSLTFLTLLTGPLSDVFQSIPQIVSAFACLGRIQVFLESETREDFRQVLPDTMLSEEKTLGNTEAPVLAIKDGSFGWEADKFVLRNINTRIPKSSLTIIVGPVGSGKSTLCKAILGEIPFSEGSVVSSSNLTHVGYCDQSAFLSNASVRDNIIGFSTFNSERYHEVLNATALSLDLGTLPQGDGTNVGSDGITLSGGQKQRVALARALYLGCDFLVLDDIFSGLDADTEEQVFQQVFAPGGLNRKRRTTVILCTHSIKHLPAADHIIVLKEGTVAEQGSFGELMTGQGYVQRLGLKDTSDNHVSSGTTTPMQEPVQHDMHTTTAKTPTIVPDTDPSRKVGDRTVYKHYVKSMGVYLAALSLFFAALWGLFTNFPTVWLTYWTNDVYSEHPAHSYGYYAGLYGVFQLCALVSLLALGICLWIVALVRAGSKLHQEILTTLVHAPLRFFTRTDTGVVTNLFSQDLNLVDTELPQAALSTLFCIFQALGQAAVMLTSSVYLAIAYPFLIAILTVMGRFYLRTSRQLRLLDLEAKSPL